MPPDSQPPTQEERVAEFLESYGYWNACAHDFVVDVGAYLNIRIYRLLPTTLELGRSMAVKWVLTDFLTETGLSSWRPDEGPLLDSTR